MYIRVVDKEIGFFKDKDVLLFGGGSCGLRALEEFVKVGARIIAFCDNNRTLAGGELNGYPIIAPEQLYDYPEACIIITSTYEDEIVQQLKEMGLDNYYCIKLGVLREVLDKKEFSNQILEDDQANRIIAESLLGAEPFFIGRLGSVELECLCHYLYFLNRKENRDMKYPGNVKMMMNVNAGFFPEGDEMLDRFSSLYMESLEEMDMIWSMWFSRYEDQLYRDYCRDKAIADYDHTVFLHQHPRPWTEALQGKKVLVIHPFEASIRENYKKRKILFGNQSFLPDFELLTLKAVQSAAGNRTEYSDWFEALNYMKKSMEKIDFDIVMIGAGAYGLPLGAYARRLGKKALHIGGILQLFFGIRGKAWNKLGVYNEHWTVPREEETPVGYKQVEAGRYW